MALGRKSGWMGVSPPWEGLFDPPIAGGRPSPSPHDSPSSPTAPLLVRRTPSSPADLPHRLRPPNSCATAHCLVLHESLLLDLPRGPAPVATPPARVPRPSGLRPGTGGHLQTGRSLPSIGHGQSSIVHRLSSIVHRPWSVVLRARLGPTSRKNPPLTIDHRPSPIGHRPWELELDLDHRAASVQTPFGKPS